MSVNYNELRYQLDRIMDRKKLIKRTMIICIICCILIITSTILAKYLYSPIIHGLIVLFILIVEILINKKLQNDFMNKYKE